MIFCVLCLENGCFVQEVVDSPPLQWWPSSRWENEWISTAFCNEPLIAWTCWLRRAIAVVGWRTRECYLCCCSLAVALKSAMKFHPGVTWTPFCTAYYIYFEGDTPFYPLGLTEKLLPQPIFAISRSEVPTHSTQQGNAKRISKTRKTNLLVDQLLPYILSAIFSYPIVQ